MPQIEVTQADGSSDTPPLDEVQAAGAAGSLPEDEPPADEPPAEEAAPAEPAEPTAEPDEVQVLIGDEAPPEEPEQSFDGPAPDWVKELREEQRRLRRQVREYEAKERVAQQQGTPAAPTLGAKPRLEDHDYDTDRYEAALESWYKQKDAVEAAKRQQEQALAEQERAWKSRLDTYGQQKAALKVRDYEDAESRVQETLNVTQQGVVIQGAENPALVVYALGKNPKKAKELAAITDPVRFAFAVAKLEQQLKITPRAKPPAPERTVPAGTAPVSGGSDTTLERLREEAARTGDMTKVVRYRQQMRAKQAAAR